MQQHFVSAVCSTTSGSYVHQDSWRLFGSEVTMFLFTWGIHPVSVIWVTVWRKSVLWEKCVSPTFRHTCPCMLLPPCSYSGIGYFIVLSFHSSINLWQTLQAFSFLFFFWNCDLVILSLWLCGGLHCNIEVMVFKRLCLHYFCYMIKWTSFFFFYFSLFKMYVPELEVDIISSRLAL